MFIELIGGKFDGETLEVKNDLSWLAYPDREMVYFYVRENEKLFFKWVVPMDFLKNNLELKLIYEDIKKIK